MNEKFDNLKTLLKNQKNAKGEDLYTHLQEVFKILILHYPDNALEKLEEVSFLLKNGDKYQIEKFLKMSDIRNYKEVCKQMEEYISKMKDQFGTRKPAADGEDGGEDPGEAEPVGMVPDLLEDSYVYQWAGIGFGQQEVYRLQKSLKKLAADTGAGSLRFWGMIRGTKQDYYIAEGELAEEGEGEDERPADFEAPGSGVNASTYWVSHSTYGAWNKLPHLSPNDIRAARTIKVLFTGDLERTIFTNPYFFEKEKVYLRAQIARISHSTTLTPKGLWRTTEDDPRALEENAPEEGEITLPTTMAMNNEAMWVHLKDGILGNCRTKHLEPTDPPEDADPEELMKQIIAADPFDAKLKPVASDNKVVVSKGLKIQPWVVRCMGDSTEYKTEAGKTVSNGVVVARSLQWPGAYNFYYQGRYMHVYVGGGHKYEEVSYFPVHPPVVRSDPDEYELQPEPTPLKEPEVQAPAEQMSGAGSQEGD